MISRIIGRNVKRLRRERGYSQEQLALEAEISPSILRMIERGEANPTIKTLGKLAASLGTTVEEFMKKG